MHCKAAQGLPHIFHAAESCPRGRSCGALFPSVSHHHYILAAQATACALPCIAHAFYASECMEQSPSNAFGQSWPPACRSPLCHKCFTSVVSHMSSCMSDAAHADLTRPALQASGVCKAAAPGLRACVSARRYSPTLQGVKVLGRRRVRRAKLYYLRDRKPSEYKV